MDQNKIDNTLEQNTLKKTLVIVHGAYQPAEHHAYYTAIANAGHLDLVSLQPPQGTLEKIAATCRDSHAVIVDAVSYGTPESGDNSSLHWRLAHDPALVAEYNRCNSTRSPSLIPSDLSLSLLRKYVDSYIGIAEYLDLPELTIPQRILKMRPSEKPTQGAGPVLFYDFGNIGSNLYLWQVLLGKGYNWLMARDKGNSSSHDDYSPDIFLAVLKRISECYSMNSQK